jgi:hypothetical protein
LLSHVLHLSDKGRIHPAKLRAPFVEDCAAHAMRAKQLRNGRATYSLLQNRMICASLYRPFFIVNLLRYLAE